MSHLVHDDWVGTTGDRGFGLGDEIETTLDAFSELSEPTAGILQAAFAGTELEVCGSLANGACGHGGSGAFERVGGTGQCLNVGGFELAADLFQGGCSLIGEPTQQRVGQAGIAHAARHELRGIDGE
jgi:hypothetical protein